MAEQLILKLRETSAKYPERDIIRHKEHDSWKGLTYKELDRKITALSSFLSREGVKKGDNVAIILANSPAWPIVFFSTVSLGAVTIPINFQAPGNEVQAILEDSRPVMVFADKAALSTHGEKSFKRDFIRKVINVEGDEFGKITADAGQNGNSREESQGVQEDDPACILYTSGTTGTPKGVVLTHGNLLANSESLNKRGIIKSEDGVISMLPLHHAYPLTVTMLLPLLYGAQIVYPQGMKGEDISEAIAQNEPSVLVAVPQFYHALHKKITDGLKDIPFPVRVVLKFLIQLLHFVRKITGINASRAVLKSVHKKFGPRMRLLASGGAKLNEKVIGDLLKFGFTLSEGYGLSETAPVLTFNPPDKPRIGSAGVAIPDVELKIVDPDKNGVGEVAARGSNVMKGYYKRDDLTKEVIKDGWFHTGDLGYFDKDGYLFLTGRAKDVIVLSSGLNILPSEIEEAYEKGAPIKEICVFEAPSPKGVKADFVLWAVVRPDLEVFKTHGEVNVKEVIRERLNDVSRTLPASSRIMGFSLTMEELPRTTLGKMKRFEIKDRYGPDKEGDDARLRERSEATEEDRELMGSENAQKIIAQLKKHFDIKKDIHPGDSLELDLGVDSLGRIELISCLEKAFSVRLRDEVVGEAFSVKDLVSRVENFLKSPEASTAAQDVEQKQGENYWKDLFSVPPQKENLEKIDLSPGLFELVVGILFFVPIYIFFKLFYRLKVEGKEHVKDIKGHILYANHTSYFDGLVLGVSLPGAPRLDMFFMGFRIFFDVPIIRRLIRVGRIIPIDMSSHLTEALRSSYYVLKNGKNLCIFPEGLRTMDGEIKEFKKGFGILAKESGAKLVPVAIEGAYEAWPRTSRFPRLHPIKVRFGKPLDVKDLEKDPGKDEDNYSVICDGAREALEKLKEVKE